MSDHARRSKLVPIGLAFVIVSFGVGSNFGSLMSGSFDFNLDALLNLLRALFVVGLAFLAAGLVRNRRWRRQFQLRDVSRQ